MEYDFEKLNNKRSELIKGLKTDGNFKTYSDDEVKLILTSFCEISPPEKEQQFMYKMTFPNPNDTTTAYSIKPGNIFLNWKKLLVSMAESSFPAYSALHFPFLAPLALLIIWNKIYSNAKVELSPDHAITIWTMWNNCDKEHLIGDDSLLNLVNIERQRNSLKEFTPSELEAILHDLQRMKCIEKWSKDQKFWWLREWVYQKYH